jgi:hypothetical protein
MNAVKEDNVHCVKGDLGRDFLSYFVLHEDVLYDIETNLFFAGAYCSHHQDE